MLRLEQDPEWSALGGSLRAKLLFSVIISKIVYIFELGRVIDSPENARKSFLSRRVPNFVDDFEFSSIRACESTFEVRCHPHPRISFEGRGHISCDDTAYN